MTNEELKNIELDAFRTMAMQGAMDMGLTEDEAERAVEDWIDEGNYEF